MKLTRGSIVWAVVPDPRGVNPKRRPIVLLTPADEIRPGVPIGGVAISTTSPDPPPPECVELNWDPQGRSSTGLRRRSWAVCTWIVEMLPESVEASDKYVPSHVVSEIIARLPAS